MGWLDFFKGKKEEAAIKKVFEVRKQDNFEQVAEKEPEAKIMLCGVELDRMPADAEELNRMMARAAISIIPHLPTEQDLY